MNSITEKVQQLGTFLRESWQEVRYKVTWPTWSEVRGTTAVVIVTTTAFAVATGILDLGIVHLIRKVFSLFA